MGESDIHMSDHRCFECEGELKRINYGRHFSYFICQGCERIYCLAHDKRGTWSWLKHANNTKRRVDCTREMHKDITEKVLFT